jgi:hypothetical protein
MQGRKPPEEGAVPHICACRIGVLEVLCSVHVQAFILLLIGIEDVLIDRLALLLIEFRRVNSRQFIKHGLNGDENRRPRRLAFLPVEH